MSTPQEQRRLAGLSAVPGDRSLDPSLGAQKALGAYRTHQLTIFDALEQEEPPLLYFPELYEVIDREIGFLDEDPARFQSGA